MLFESVKDGGKYLVTVTLLLKGSVCVCKIVTFVTWHMWNSFIIAHKKSCCDIGLVYYILSAGIIESFKLRLLTICSF